MARLVSESSSLIVFPEGTRSVTGELGRFKKGSFLVALDAKLPVVPLTIGGSRHVMMKGQLMVRPGDVELTIHEPIATVASEEPNIREVRALAQRVRAIIQPAVEAEAAR
jgi:1-acyl-sn-glycerol-3-phosphate acyltransferase